VNYNVQEEKQLVQVKYHLVKRLCDYCEPLQCLLHVAHLKKVTRLCCHHSTYWRSKSMQFKNNTCYIAVHKWHSDSGTVAPLFNMKVFPVYFESVSSPTVFHLPIHLCGKRGYLKWQTKSAE